MLTISNEKMIPELKSLWKTAFGDTDELIEMFFSERYQPHNSAVCIIDGEVAASVYMLPCTVKTEKAQYIYAAATKPKHRGRGYMAKLLLFAEQTAKQNGIEYSCLVPANEKLFEYYEKQGYKTFFYINKIILTRNELESKIHHKNEYNVVLDFDIEKIRNNILSKSNYNVLWDKNAINYAIHMNSATDGGTIKISLCGKGAYLIYRQWKNTAEITECFSETGMYEELFSELLRVTTAEKYIIITSSAENILDIRGEILPFGMIRSLKGKALPEIKNNLIYPYLGLPLD